MRHFTLIFLVVFSAKLYSQTLVVKPYLQNASPTSMHVMWETSADNSTAVEYGLTNALGSSTSGSATTGSGSSYVHDVNLTGLLPATRYYYKAITGSLASDVYFFRTPPLASSESSFNIVAMSDMQQDAAHPTVFSDLINQNLIPYLDQKYSNDLATDLAYFFTPGDHVQNGADYASWANTFFHSVENLVSYVPHYPIIGNHEGNSPNYFRYFNLPLNGSQELDYPEHWWYKDYSNVRMIGLETNTLYSVQAQLDWLQNVLDDAASNDTIDFVFAEMHHPYHSELWIAGNTNYTGQIITLLENFTSASGKPSVHFFGHTHGYSRGQSKESAHVMVNVASGGGAIDNWGEFAQFDYPEYNRSDDDFGYVLLEVQAGNDPQFLLSRLSHGSYEDGLVTNELKDSIRIKLNNASPAQPTGVFPGPNAVLSPDCIIFLGSEFSDPDGDLHGATQWQIATDANFSSLVYDEWYQYEDWYFDVDLLAGNNMVDQQVNVLQENSTYYWRVRYRDRSLAWSSWSDASMFQTTTSNLTPNLLINGGAEDGTNGWAQDLGYFESIGSGECAGNTAYAGSHLFAVGGVCTDSAYGEGHQDVDVSSYQTLIDASSVSVIFSGYLSDYNGADVPSFKVQFYDSSDMLISESETISHSSSTWTLYSETLDVPATTTTVRMVMMGTRNAGSDNDSYFDEMSVRLNLNGTGCEEYVQVGTDELLRPLHVRAFPNPFSDRCTIDVSQPEHGKSYKLQLFDRTGRMIREQESSTGKFIIDSEQLAKGFYLYQVSLGNWSTQGKLVLN